MPRIRIDEDSLLDLPPLDGPVADEDLEASEAEVLGVDDGEAADGSDGAVLAELGIDVEDELSTLEGEGADWASGAGGDESDDVDDLEMLKDMPESAISDDEPAPWSGGDGLSGDEEPVGPADTVGGEGPLEEGETEDLSLPPAERADELEEDDSDLL